jgi:hypothetical protein
MKLETIMRLQARCVDMSDKHAAMRFAWRLVAQDHWSRRDYGPVGRNEMARALKDAHACVRTSHRHAKQRELADKDPRVAALREQRRLLENKSFNVSIRQDQARIDQQINKIIREMENDQ